MTGVQTCALPILDCAETIIAGALTRTESRGAHFRTDYLDREDDEWLKHILLYHSETGSPHIEYLPVKITQDRKSVV